MFAKRTNSICEIRLTQIPVRLVGYNVRIGLRDLFNHNLPSPCLPGICSACSTSTWYPKFGDSTWSLNSLASRSCFESDGADAPFSGSTYAGAGPW